MYKNRSNKKQHVPTEAYQGFQG